DHAASDALARDARGGDRRQLPAHPPVPEPDAPPFRDRGVHGPRRRLRGAPRSGCRLSQVPAGDYEALEDAIRPTTRVLVSESPTNPYNRILDLDRFADLARAHRVTTLIDAKIY